MKTVAVLVVMFALTGCASIMQGASQEVSVSSSPTGAQVSVNGQYLGTTPAVLDLKRKNNHTIKIALDGYEPYEITLNRKVSGWVAGNIVFGGILGLAIDAITGGMYKLSPTEVSAALARGGVASVDKDQVLIMVVLEPEPGWEQIAQLERR